MTCGVLNCFFVIVHGRRRILHCNITKHQSSAWVAQQLAFFYDYSSYLIFERAANFNEEVVNAHPEGTT
jgi:hypothetical protein